MTLGAKIEQIMLGIKIDHAYSKQQILRAYLASVYIGLGCYGVTVAAQGYFGLAASQLSWAQASLLAGLVQAPTAYNSLTHLDFANQRQRDVLDQIVATGMLSPAQAATAFAAPTHVRTDSEHHRRGDHLAQSSE